MMSRAPKVIAMPRMLDLAPIPHVIEATAISATAISPTIPANE
jgi:hypothetical protein